MFGTDAQTTNDDPAMLDSVNQLTNEQLSSTGQPTAPPAQPHQQQAQTPLPSTNQVQPHPEPAAGFSSMPISDPASSNVPVSTPPVASNPPVQDPAPAVDDSAQTASVGSVAAPTDAPTSPIDHQQLAGMKQHALDHLEPLVEHLEQSAEEEFKTTMMMIQSNDNHTLLEKALDAAKRITDDKQRAEALLDIINEINYFASQNVAAN